MTKPDPAAAITAEHIAAAIARFAAERATIETDEDGDIWLLVHRNGLARTAGFVITDSRRRPQFAPYYTPVTQRTAATDSFADYPADFVGFTERNDQP